MYKKFFQLIKTVIILAGLLIFFGNAAIAQPNNAYTVSLFGKGTMLNLNSDNGYLQLNAITQPFPFINVAASKRGTLVRVNTRTGEVVGEYLTSPYQRPHNPSRTTVDLYGNVWVGNRNESYGGKGSVVKIGLIMGGTRCNADGTPNPNGEYLKPPFDYNTCVDRNGDGLIKTSRGLLDTRPWNNTGWVDNNGGVSTADDEAILLYVRTNGTNVRHVSVDADNNVWIGGYTNGYFDLLDGETGNILASFNKPLKPYGGLVDRKGVIWSSSRSSNGLLRYDPNGTPSDLSDDKHQFIRTRDSYGIATDMDGNIWLAQAYAHSVYKFHPDGTVFSDFPKSILSSEWGPPGLARGVAVTPKDNHVWVANSHGRRKVVRLNNDGNILKDIPVGSGPTGVAVDADGKVWVSNYDSHNIMRIDPNAGEDGLGQVDLTVSLGAGAGPYNYSDMTGVVAMQTSMQGTWTVTHDSEWAGTEWKTVSWNSDEPAGTNIAVAVRASDTQGGLAGKSWTETSNGAPLDGVAGQYIEIRTNFKGEADTDASPVLRDLTVTYPEPPPIPVLAIKNPGIGHHTCDDSIIISATATDELGIAAVFVNGTPVDFTPTGNPDPNKLNEVSFSAPMTLDFGANNIEIAVTNTSDQTVLQTRITERLSLKECAPDPVLHVENPPQGYLLSDHYTCEENITVSGTVGDVNGIKTFHVNGMPVILVPNENDPEQASFSTSVGLNLENNTIEVTATNTFDKTAVITRTVYRFESGVFIVGADGIVKIDWLFDGGDYQGEIGIFSLSDMENLTPNSVEFIKEATRRALSNSEQGYVVISDKIEGARFSGYLGESEDHNSGPYKGIKSFNMKPGDSFATILVPNYTLTDLYSNPSTTEIRKRPLFSLASANPNHEMYVGQTAAINDQDNAFIYEDKNFVESDRDFNDFIFQIKGVIVCEGRAPTLDRLKADGTFKKDWRKTTVLGTQVVEHIESPSVQDDTMWISVVFQGLADFFIYDPDGRVIGKEGGYIPGATFETDQDGNQIISLPALEEGDYRLVMRSTGSAEATLKVRGYKGEAELVTADVTFPMKPHQTFSSVLEAANFIVDTVIDIQTPKIPEGPDGNPLLYDFDADGDIDVGDIMKIASRWESEQGDDGYDSFFDFNDDGRITLSDIIKVVNSRND
ncbi:MAG: DUF4114 domain-containing protein [Desulfobacterales bacterium]|nr:DUF4114 domain-containing protein [Desulfobacterales bacterium]